MKKKRDFGNVGIDCAVFCTVLLLATVTACSREAAPPANVVVQPAAPAPQTVQVVQPAPEVVLAQDDYVYYPEYEVYYSNSRHQYGYRDGNAWLWRPAPPRVALNVLVGSPSVHMDFHDSPAFHHDVVVRSYPRNWSPPGKGRDDRNDHKDDKRDDRKDRH